MNKITGIFAIAFVLVGLFAFFNVESFAMKENSSDLLEEMPDDGAKAYFAGGCFWCTEYEYRAIDGVLYTRVGYMGGELENPTYRDITTGKTGHAEVVEVTFNPDKVAYENLVEYFLTTIHDPTQLNRQGVDVGTQYRSAIFPVDDAQEATAKEVIERVDAGDTYDKPIVTTIEPLGEFWLAEDYHQQYYEKYKQETGQTHIRVIMKGKK
ncbi:MAG: peptide-methionine (S)-S-oxide reductase MsrA [Alphaproteobacteria bacterium]|nr:peptide-methionine (S)-S-oxide reductase MsrA [Alphaproteobacteria bacterium]